MINYPSVMRAERELLFENGDWKHVLIVHTGLQLDPEGSDYDAKQEADLLAAIADYLDANPATIDTAVVRSSRIDS